MNNPKIKSLFKYCTFNTRLVSALVSRKLWYPSASTFNDPFDCSLIDFAHNFVIGREKTIKQFLKRPLITNPEDILGSKIEKRLRDIHDTFYAKVTEQDRTTINEIIGVRRTLQESFYDFGILCLSETPKNILMWSHYASNHTGLCLEFERVATNELGKNARPVKYVRRRFNDNKPEIVFEKYVGWKYEGEWRHLANKGDCLYPFPGRLLSVTCGARMPQQDREIVQHLLRSIEGRASNRAKFRLATMSPNRYEIVLKQVQ